MWETKREREGSFYTDLWPLGSMCECVCKENEKVKYCLGEEGYRNRERERERERGGRSIQIFGLLG